MTAADWPRRPVTSISYRDGVGPNNVQVTVVSHAVGEQADEALWKAVEAAARGNNDAFRGTAAIPRRTAPLGKAPPELAIFREPATIVYAPGKAMTVIEWGTWRRHADHEDHAAR